MMTRPEPFGPAQMAGAMICVLGAAFARFIQSDVGSVFAAALTLFVGLVIFGEAEFSRGKRSR